MDASSNQWDTQSTVKGVQKLILGNASYFYQLLSTLLVEIPARYQRQVKVFSWPAPTKTTDAHVEESFGTDPEAFLLRICSTGKVVGNRMRPS